MLAVLMLVVGTASAQTPPPAGTWAQIPNTRPYDAMAVAEFYSGQSAYNPQSLFDYSGGDVVQLSGVWGFVLTGGGHAATPDNSTIFVPFDGSGPRQLQGPYTSPDGIYRYDVPWDIYKPSGIWTDARKSVHTYSAFITVEKNGRPFLFLGGGGVYTGSGGGTVSTRLFDTAQTRAQALALPDLGWQKMANMPRSSGAGSAGWDPVKRRVVFRGQTFIGAYSVDTDTWDNWPLNPTATICCDFQASVAVDVAGRQMYVLGDGLAERYDLDACPGAGCYTDLSTQPWAVSFVQRGTLAPSSWHAASRRLITWGGGQNLTATDPITGIVTALPMGGATVTPPRPSGTYGRFRVIPGTDQVVLVNGVFEQVFIGTLGAGGGGPPPPPPLSTATLTAAPSAITQGQSAVLTLFTPTLDYHNVFVNGVRPAGMTSGSGVTWKLTVTPSVTTLYQATATNAQGAPYQMPSVTVAVTVPTTQLSVPASITASTPASASPQGYGLRWTASLASKAFSAASSAASYKFRMVEIATGYVNDLLVPYAAAGQQAPPNAGFAYVRNGSYDLFVSLVDQAGATLVDFSGALASAGPVRVVVPIAAQQQATLTATPSAVSAGQSSRLELSLPTSNYHLIAINGAAPTCSVFGAGYSCVLTVAPAATTTYAATAQNSSGVPYQIPSVTVIVSGTPPPSTGLIRVPAGQQIPVRTWVERPLPWDPSCTVDISKAELCGVGPSKHERMFYHPSLRSMVIGGGDRAVGMPHTGYNDGTGSEIVGLDAVNDKWTTLRAFCVPGEPQPGRPDNVPWAYDSKRNRAIMTPGFYFITQGGVNSGCGAVEGWGAYTLDFATGKWLGPNDAAGIPVPSTNWGGDSNSSFGIYDPVADEFIRLFNGGGPDLQFLNLGTKAWRSQRVTRADTPGWNPIWHRTQPALDVAGRALYVLDVWNPVPALLKINLTTAVATVIPLPPQWRETEGAGNDIYLAFDPVNRVLLIPNQAGMGRPSLYGLGLYAVDTGTWSWEAVPQGVMGGAWGFDEATGTLVGVGKRESPFAYYLYKAK